MHLSFSSTLLKHCFSGAKYENHVMSKKPVGSNPDPTGFYLYRDDVGLLVCAFAFDLIKNDFAQAQMVRCHFHIFIFFDIFQGFFKREYYRRNNAIEGARRLGIQCFLRHHR